MRAKFIAAGDKVAMPDGTQVTVTSTKHYTLRGEKPQMREQIEFDNGLWDCPSDLEVPIIALNAEDHHG